VPVKRAGVFRALVWAGATSSSSMRHLLYPLITAGLLTGVPGLAAQNAPDAGAAEAPGGSRVTEGRLSPFVVEAADQPELRAAGQASPGTVFGTATDLLAVPRGVTPLNEGLLERYAAEDVRSSANFIPGAYTPGRFGHATTPNIRGDVAEAYVNGQRRTANLFGFKPVFNGVERLEAVRGPGSPRQGPGFYSGGYLNYVLKLPGLETNATELSARGGRIAEDGSGHGFGRWSVDQSLVLREGELGLRMAYEGQEDDTRFAANGGRDDHQDLFVSALWLPDERTRVEFYGEYLWQAAPQLLGVNRPTQELVDSGTYLTGDLPLTALPGAALTPTGTTTIGRNDTLLSTGDFSNANVVLAQAVVTQSGTHDAKLVNKTLLEHVDRRRFHEFEYAEYVDQFTFEHRTEAHYAFEGLGVRQEAVSGAALRFEYRESYVNFFNELFTNFDISQGPPVHDASDYVNQFVPGLVGPGGQQFFGSAQGSPETTLSRVWNLGLFHEHSVRLSESTTLLIGLRGDAYQAWAEDPLPAPGTPRIEDGANFVSGSFNVNLVHRFAERFSGYAGFTRTHAVNGSVAGGGIMLFNGEIQKDDFRNRSDLYEAGLRYRDEARNLSGGLTAFWQERRRTEFRGGKSDIVVRGIEHEGYWEPAPGLFLWENLTYQLGNFEDSAPFQAGGRSLFDLYAPTPFLPEATGNGPDIANQVPAGDYRIPGFSNWLANAGITARAPGGWGGSFWGSWHDEQTGNLDAEYVIPAQFTLNAQASYRRGNWEAGITVTNLTNERNWIHSGDTFLNNVLIFQSAPRTVELFFRAGW